MKRIAILGSTGSIGTQTLDVVNNNPDRFRVAALTCGSNASRLAEQIEAFRPEMAVTAKEEDAAALRARYADTDLAGVRILSGEEGLIEAVRSDCDMVVNSLMGMRGLVPTHEAILAGRDVALANKETLVAGGNVIMREVAEQGIRLLPIDSEHSAIFQCLMGNEGKKIRRILLTASGGPFRGWTKEQLKDVTFRQALKHPNWSMGRKITIDSATMMNKGLEVIEAKWLFGVEIDDIEVIVHPQSIIHSAVEFDDTAVIAQLGVPDMRVPISVALGYPDRLHMEDKGLDFFALTGGLTFERPDTEVFRCLDIARESSRTGGTYPAVMNAANEVLVEAFLEEKIGFLDIPAMIEKVLSTDIPGSRAELPDILEADRRAREEARRLVGC
ncbi:MAG: 1-deoxy-D-xylulose-5-phosphate reductoisomerase [Eubacterium sp.]|nr:1-deoxy-D-xylulose-5-phosphate reductoisomerase [Eubacterium sp.]